MMFPCLLDKSPRDLYYTGINMEYIYNDRFIHWVGFGAVFLTGDFGDQPLDIVDPLQAIEYIAI